MKFVFHTGGAVAALAAALAFTAVPAQARQAGDQDPHGWQQRAAQSGEREHGRAAREQAAPQRAAPAPQRAAQAPQARPEQRTAQAQRNGAEARQQQRQRTDVQAARQQQLAAQRTSQAQRSYTQRAPTQQRSQWGNGGQQAPQRSQRGGSTQQTDRNRSYDRGDRNTTYRNNTGGNWSQRGGDRSYQGSHNGGRQWDRTWRNNNRYDWQHYRSSNRNVYHVGRYYAPYRGYSYRPLGIGFYLDSLFFGQNYWINDPGYYRLPDVYGPYRWVRYYDDALLVDIYSGEVVDVINNFFW